MKRLLVAFSLSLLFISTLSVYPKTLLAEDSLVSLGTENTSTTPSMQEIVDENILSEGAAETPLEESLLPVEAGEANVIETTQNNPILESGTQELPTQNVSDIDATLMSDIISARTSLDKSTSTEEALQNTQNTDTGEATSETTHLSNFSQAQELETQVESNSQCASCEKDSRGNSIEIVVDENVTIDFNQVIPICVGDQDLCQFFTYEKNGTTANTWNAIFDLGGKRLVVKNGASIKTTQIPTGTNNRHAPGIIIKTTCSIFVEEGALIEVQSLNQPAGDILIKGGSDVVIHGFILNTVGGTMQTPGQITIVSCCNNIITGAKSRIMVTGADYGGRNIDILARNNIELHGLIESNYRSGATSTVNVISFNGTVLVDGANRFPDEIENTRIPRTSGIFVYAKHDPLPGQITIRAKGDITVLGNIILDKHSPNFGAIAVKTASNSSKSGTIDVRSLEGSITARDRAFDNANRYSTKGSITLFAKNDISFSVTDNRNDGATTTEKIIVNSEAYDVRTIGGNNIIRSYSGALRISEHATLSTENKNGIDGKNILTSCKGIVNNGRIQFPDLDTGDDMGVCDPSAPLANTDTTQKILLAKISSYAHGALRCLLDEHEPPENHAPVITILGDNPLTIIQGNTFTDPGATAFDQEDGNITARIVVGGSSITPATIPGTYVITYNVRDTQGLPAPEATRTVLVITPKPQCSDGIDNDGDGKIDQADPACHTDNNPENDTSYNPDINDENMAPIIKLLGLNPFEIENGTPFVDPGATAQDQEDGNITARIVVSGDVITSSSTPGTYTIVYNVKDSKNVPAPEVRRTVIVKQTVPPPPKPQCSDGIDNDGDGKIDQADPACHTDENPDNTTSYNPAINDENSKPLISLLGNNPFFITFGATFTDPGATAFDKEDGNITARIVIAGNAITNTSPVGTYTITYNVKDSKGASAPEAKRTVVISPVHPQCSDDADNDRDDLTDSMDPACHTDGDPTNDTSYDPTDPDENMPPTLTLNGENPITIVIGGPFTDPGATAQDQEDGNITAHIVVSGDKIASTTPAGSYTIKYDVKDSKGASAPQISRTVIVQQPASHPQCSDGIDNDTDTKIDKADPACHTDGDPANETSYNPDDTNENATPTITVLGNNPYEIRTGDAFSDPGATAFDQEDGNITAHIVVSGDVITSSTAVGAYGIVYNVKDSTGKSAPEAKRIVTITPKNNPPSNGGGGGGGGGSSGSSSNSIVGGGGILQQTNIVITNERAVSLSDTSALITWTTNIPGTSMVVYGTSTRALADGSRINFGYTNTTDKRAALIKDHSIVIDGLIPKIPYYFRPISEEWSSKAIGKEVTISEAPKECNYLLEYLKYGANNNPVEVRKLQVFLRNFEGFSNLGITGFFDLTTFNAVSQFQQKYFDLVLAPWGHDKPTGYVYITTKKRVNEIYCAREFALTDAQKQEIQIFKAYPASLNVSPRPQPTRVTPPSVPQKNTTPTQPQTIASDTQQNISTSSTPHTDQSSTTPTTSVPTDTEPPPGQINSPPLNLDETPVGLEQKSGFQNLLASVFTAPASSGATLECIIALLIVLALIILMEIIWRKPMHHISDKIFFWIIGVFIAIPVALILHLGCIVLPLAAILILLSVLYAINKKEEAR